MYVILATFFAIFFFYSCTSTKPTETNETNEVTITIDRLGAHRNATLVLAQDGLSGEWKELTGNGGIYKFIVNDPDGVYSVVAVDEETNSDHFHRRLFHGTLSEAKTVNFEFSPDHNTDFAKLNITVPEAYANAMVSVFFLKREASYNSLQGVNTTVELPKGKGELVVVMHDLNTGVPTDVYINRNFDLQNERSLTIGESELKTLGQAIQSGDDGITYDWVLSKTLVPGKLFPNMKIPDELVRSSDRYMAEYSQQDKPLLSWWKVTSDGAPVTVKDGVKTLEPTFSTIDGTETVNELPRVSFNPYLSTVTDYDVKYYNFDISTRIGNDPSPVGTHFITITPAYLEKIENVYTFPSITSANWKNAYNPTADYVIQVLKICLSPNTIDEINSLENGTEWTIFGTDLMGAS